MAVVSLTDTFQRAVVDPIQETRLPDVDTNSVVASNSTWYGESNAIPKLLIDTKGRVLAASNITTVDASIITQGTLPSSVFPNVGTSGSFGSSNSIPVISVDDKGRVTNASNLTILDASIITKGTLPSSVFPNVGTSGSFGSSNSIPVISVDDKGRVTNASNVTTFNASIITQGTLPSSVLPNVGTSGSFGSANSIPVITLDDKGRVTNASNVTTLNASILPNVGTSGSFGSSNSIPVISVDDKGRVLSGSNVTILDASIIAQGTLPSSVLPNVGTSGSFGSANSIPIITVDTKGRVTNACNVSFTAVSGGFTVDGSTTSTNLNLSVAGTLGVSGATSFSNNVTVANNLSTLNINVTGAVSLPTGSVNSNALVASGATAGTYGSATAIPTLIVNSQGLITGISTTAVSIPPPSGFTVSGSNISTSSNLTLSGTATFSNTVTFLSNVNFNTTTSSNLVTNSGVLGSNYSMCNAPSNGLIVQGNVGIGLTNPSARLDVTGTARFNGVITANSNVQVNNDDTALTVGYLTNSWGLVKQGGRDPVFGCTQRHDNFYNKFIWQQFQSSNFTGLSNATPFTEWMRLEGGNLGIGTNVAAPTNRLTVSGGASIGNGYVNNTSPSNGMIVQGSVGIGITNPVTPLHIVNTNTSNEAVTIIGGDISLSNNAGRVQLKIRNTQFTSGNNESFNVIQTNGGEGWIQNATLCNMQYFAARHTFRINNFPVGNNAAALVVGSNIGIGFETPQTLLDVNGATTLRGTVSVSNNAFVGIGTGSPSHPLHVRTVFGGSNAFNTTIGIQHPLSGTAFTFEQDSNANGNINNLTQVTFAGAVNSRLINIWGNASSSNFYGISLGSSTINWRTGDTGSHVFLNQNTELARIDSSGRVMFGTTTPAERLTVNGNVSTTGIRIPATNGYMIDNKFTLSDVDRYGIHVASSTYRLFSAGTGSASLALSHLSSVDGSGNPSFTDRLFVLNNGNIGIGTANPSRALDVRGSSNQSLVTMSNASFATTLELMSGGRGSGASLQISQATNGEASYNNQSLNAISRYVVNGASGSHLFQTNGTNSRVAITETGLGINTTNPSRVLDVRGSSNESLISMSNQGSFDTVLELMSGGRNTGSSVQIQQQTNGNTLIENKSLNNSSFYRVNGTGNHQFQINTSSILQVNSGGIDVTGTSTLRGKVTVTTGGIESIGDVIIRNAAQSTNVQILNKTQGLSLGINGDPGNQLLKINNIVTTASRSHVLVQCHGTNQDQIIYSTDRSGGGGWSWGQDCVNGDVFKIGSAWDNITSTTALTILRNGNVGISTTTPSTLLDVNGTLTVRSTGILNVQGNTTQSRAIKINNTTPLLTRSIQLWGDDNSNQSFYGFGMSSGTLVYNIMNSAGGGVMHQFTSGGTELMRIKSNGFVGINNIDPLTALDVNGTSTLRDNVNIGINSGVTRNIQSPGQLRILANTANAVNNAGLILAAGTNVYGGNGFVGIAANNFDYGYQILVNKNQQVGIGGNLNHDTPLSAQLHVFGDFMTSGSILATNNSALHNIRGRTIFTDSSLTTDYGRVVILSDPSGVLNSHLSILNSGVGSTRARISLAGATVAGINSLNIDHNRDGGALIQNNSSLGSIVIFAGNTESIRCTTTTTTVFNTSDYRMKDIIEPIADSLNKVCLLDTYYFTFKNDESKKKRWGVIAHELQNVFPELVEGHKDQVNEDGSEKYQSVDYGGIIPILIASIKDLKKLNDSLQDRITVLENKLSTQS